MALRENLTSAVGDFFFIWNLSYCEALNLKMCKLVCYSSFSHSVRVNMESSSDGIAKIDRSDITVHEVFSTCLDPRKTWFALNTHLCCTKPSTFCSSATAKLFHEEYALVSFEDLRGKDGVPASSKWFHSKGLRSDKVHVATAFGLILGILRLKTLEDCPFIKSRYFDSVVSLLNAKAFDLDLESSTAETPELIKLKSHILAIENQLSSASQEILSLHEKLKSFKNEDAKDLPTPPATPSPPKFRALPPKSNMEKNIPNQLSPRQETPKRLRGARKRRISELKVDEELSPKTKRRKIRERVRSVVKQLNRICHAKGESLGSILGECCINGGKDTAKAQEAVRSAFDIMIKEKGARVTFSKLLSEETLDARAQSMRLPDWVLVLFKLKSRISDKGWQDFINLTKLGRTGVSYVLSFIL